jgi:hypothetical protein
MLIDEEVEALNLDIWISQCWQFVEIRERNGDYEYYHRERNVNNIEYAKLQDFLAKIGEFYAQLYLAKRFNFPSNVLPDLKIIPRHLKSFSADLQYKTTSNFPNVHVKTCFDSTFNFCKDYSWIIQFSNKSGYGGKDDLFLKSRTRDDLMVLVHVGDTYRGTIKAILSVSETLSLLREPLREDKKGIKKAIYFSDIRDLK